MCNITRLSFALLFFQDSTNISVFHQAILSPMTKPVPVVTAAISLMSSFQTSVCFYAYIDYA